MSVHICKALFMRNIKYYFSRELITLISSHGSFSKCKLLLVT